MSKHKVRFVHSFSTKPIKVNCYNIGGIARLLSQIWYFSLSVAYLKKLGATIVLHTDSLGKQLLSHLPYDEIHLTLDNYDEGLHPRFWAAGKFLAIRKETPPFIHIDGDVFIKSQKCLDLLENKLLNSDLLVQGEDPAKMYMPETPMFNSEQKFCKEHYCTPDGENAYNTGTLGINSEDVKHSICYNYFDIVKYISERYSSTLDNEPYITPDLIAEQKMIKNLSDARNYKVEIVLKDLKDAINIDYQHVYTVDKIDKLNMCKDTLKIIDKNIYKATSLLCD